jgi:two-component system NtrC family sensor kinase
VIDLSGKISYANPTAARILGHDEADLRGESVERFFGAPDGTSSLVAQALEEGTHSKGSELMLELADGRAIPIGISCTPLLDDEGGIRGAVAIFQDLTEIKELQRQVLQQEKMASIGQLAAGIAHEINNPVGFIHANLAQMAEYLADLSGFLDMVGELQQALSSGVESEVKRASAALEETASRIDVDYVRKDFGNALRESLEGSERIRHIVSDLRQFSHRGGVETTLADINQCVDSTANIVWTMMKHSVELEKDYQDLPLLRCHPMQIEQVFMNLLVNAYQSIEEALADSPEEIGTIGIATRERDGGIEVRITDTGSGISAGDLQRIFDPFYTTKEVGVGTGLGLSTSYGIVKQHGGEIEVSSEPGRGSCFAVWLPLGSDKEPGQSESTSARSD